MIRNLRHAIKQLTPPVLWDAAVKLMAFPWKTFETWETAAASCSSYENDLLNGFRIARDDLNRKNGRVIDLEGNALLWVTSLLPGSLAVTDFGGATGEFGAALQLLRPQVEYTVVENPALVAALAANNNSVRFATKIPGECDVFFTSSSLQYIGDPYGVLVAGFRSAKSAVILARNNFSERERFRVQRSPLFNNGGGAIPAGFSNSTITYPLRTISERRVRAVASEFGFKLIARVPEPSEGLAHLDKAYSAQLVFLRANTA
jgi:putative methyltransferase (TIGR04325 family)